MRGRRLPGLLGLILLGLVVTLSACGGGDDSSSTAAGTAASTTGAAKLNQSEPRPAADSAGDVSEIEAAIVASVGP